MRKLAKFEYLGILIVVLFASPSRFVLAGKDPSVEEILRRHAEAVGTEAGSARAQNRIAIGKSEFEVTLPSWRSSGKVIFASDENNLMLISSFDLPEYAFERVGMFNGKLEIPFVSPGERSPMGNYLLLNDNIVGERLFGGVVSTQWRMLRPASIIGRLRFGGSKKLHGREAYVVRYYSKGNASADSGVDIYFDARDFRHLRTEYFQKMPEKYFYRMGIFGNQEGENSNRLVEDFDDFRVSKGLTLPHKYTVKLILDGRSGTKEFRWTFKFDEYRISQNLAGDFFTFDKR